MLPLFDKKNLVTQSLPLEDTNNILRHPNLVDLVMKGTM